MGAFIMNTLESPGWIYNDHSKIGKCHERKSFIHLKKGHVINHGCQRKPPLRSFDTLYLGHLLSIGQTEIIYYNLPDIRKLLQKHILIRYLPICL